MSRIHDALKKAELERSAVPGIELTASPIVPKTNGTSENHSASVAADHAVTQAAVMAPGSGDGFEVEHLLARCAHRRWNPDSAVNVFSASSSTQAAEQFRTLRSRLYQLRGNQPLRTLLVTSSVSGEGKTFVASNLAQAIIRQPDRRVLLIDADLRCSRLHERLGAPSAPGLTDYLRGGTDEASIIQTAQDSNLYFIPGGGAVANPSELLSNGRLKSLLDRVAPAFDWIVIDSPPCLPVADATVLADFCDGVLLVVKACSTPAAVVQRSRQELHGRSVVGVVLNIADEGATAHGSYYGYGYYGHQESKPEAAQKSNGKLK